MLRIMIFIYCNHLDLTLSQRVADLSHHTSLNSIKFNSYAMKLMNMEVSCFLKNFYLF